MKNAVLPAMAALLAASLSGSIVAPVAAAHPGHHSEASADEERGCALPPGWSEVEALDPEFIVFGELHGTAEAPEFVSDLVCALAAKGERVLLAMEINSPHDPALQEAWASAPQDFRQALQSGGWERRNDGVGSDAMLEMVVRAHSLKSQGAPISVVAFNGARDDAQRARFAHFPGQGPHEAAQAENIALAAEAGEFDRVIVLVGNLHAMRSEVSTGGTTFEPMALKLEQYGSVIGLKMLQAPGTSWSCRLQPGFKFVAGEPLPPDAIQCAEHPSGATGEFDREPFIALPDADSEEAVAGFDGFFWVGPITASPPAFIEEDREAGEE